jgi:hypothetical protein
MVGRTRIHLDKVEGLGDFLELEVVLADDEPPETGMAVANELLGKLAIPQSQLIDKAYVDMLPFNMSNPSVSSATPESPKPLMPCRSTLAQADMISIDSNLQGEQV